MFNDDVVRGKIEAILMHADDVKAEELRAAAEKKAHEDTHPTCATNWMVCTNNTDLVKNNPTWFKIQLACQLAANKAARYGEPKWGWVPFGKYLPGNGYRATGTITAIDDDVRFQNGFGVYGRSRVVCIYDLRNGLVANMSVTPQ
jgi:hypothetical protein